MSTYVTPTPAGSAVSDPQHSGVEDPGHAGVDDLLDMIMPTWTRRESHSLRWAGPGRAVMLAADQLTWPEVPLLTDRLGGSGVDPGTPVRSSLTKAGYALLASSSRARVYGSVRPWAADRSGSPGPWTAASPVAHRGPGVAVVLGVGYSPGRIVIESRCLARDPRSRRALDAYWALTRPTSGLLRRRWLSAIRERATWTLTESPVTGDIV